MDHAPTLHHQGKCIKFYYSLFEVVRNDSGSMELLIIYNFIDSFRNLFSVIEIQYT